MTLQIASTTATQKKTLLSRVQELTEIQMRAVDKVIDNRLHSDVALINQLSAYIINSGGKRVRPLLVLLSAGAFGYEGKQHLDLAAIIELIHTATLLHDDVVDHSLMRRGQQSANALFGNEASVLVGDFLYSRSFQMMVDVGNIRILQILAQATNTIAEGEVLQLMNRHDTTTSEETYLQVIRCKTAKLFEAAAQIGAVIAGQDERQASALARYGMHLGTAFQLIDDVLDYTGSPDQIGKNLGDDLAEGKPTLPLIYTLHHGSRAQAELIRAAVKAGGLELIDQVTQAIRETKAIEYTSRKAQEEVRAALQAIEDLPASEYLQALIELAKFSVQRDH